MQNSVADPIAPPMRAPPSRPMPAPAQKWPLVPSPLERRVTEVVGMTNAALLDCARMSALWATPRLGARSSGRTMAAKRRGMRNLLGDETDGASRINASEGFNMQDRKSTRLNSSHGYISYAVFCLKKKKKRRAKSDDRERENGDEH